MKGRRPSFLGNPKLIYYACKEIGDCHLLVCVLSVQFISALEVKCQFFTHTHTQKSHFLLLLNWHLANIQECHHTWLMILKGAEDFPYRAHSGFFAHQLDVGARIPFHLLRQTQKEALFRAHQHQKGAHKELSSVCPAAD